MNELKRSEFLFSMSLAEKVYQKLREVPAGKVTTYKLLAEAVGSKAYRAVGSILSRNPNAPEVPCHRVVASDGRIGGFMGRKDGEAVARKQRLLRSEGVSFAADRIAGFEKILCRF